MTPTITQIKLLREVIGGRTVFAPKSDSESDIESFQSLAEELIELGENNFLTGCRPKRESYSGKGQIVRVLVVGLTAAGRKLAQSGAAPFADENGKGVTCPNCNHSLRAGAKFCDNCGFSLVLSLDSTLPISPTPPSASTDSFVGKILQGKYQIISEIGKGGMGRVYRAKHLKLLGEMAIKIIEKKFVSDANAVERFMREARAAAKLKHPNVITTDRPSNPRDRF